MIEVTGVVKRYGPATVLNGATFRIATSQLTTILGPSGCGKSTMLRCLNRLERFDDGRILIDDVELHGSALRTLSAADEDALVWFIACANASASSSRTSICSHISPHLATSSNRR